MTSSVSLQTRLVRGTLISSMVAGLIAFVLLIAITVIHTMDIQDQIMDEVSDLLLTSDAHIPSATDLNELTEEFDLQYSLDWKDKTLTYSDHHDDITHTQHLEKGYGYFFHQGELWRSYEAEKNESELKVMVIQPIKARFSEVFQSILWYAAGLIFLWLLQWGLLKWTVRRQLAPLHHLSHLIGEKTVDNLQPIPNEDLIFTELQPVISSLNQLLVRLERALSAEQRFTADASHELRSPLSAIQMRLELIKRKFADIDSLNADIDNIQIDVKRSTQILENLLLLARLDPSKANELPKKSIEMLDLISEVKTNLMPFAIQKNIVITSLYSQQNGVVNANQELIYSCIRNILENAIRYTPDHGQVFIHLLNQDAQLIVKIEDTGTGVEPEILPQLGQRFFRVLGTKQKGTGLGLSISQKILELHYGQLIFDQSKYGGLCVEIRLPVDQSVSD